MSKRLVLLLFPALLAAQPEPGARMRAQQSQNSPSAAPSAPAARPAIAAEITAVTRHKGRFGGQELAYTTTLGTLHLKDAEGAVKASVFYAAYTKDDADPLQRPVSFVFNGGPGSASLWTHMGLGPRRPVLADNGQGAPGPYALEDNGDSFLDATDLVFIDAMSTGFSRPAPGENPAQFFGLVNDATLFADFIAQYVTRTTRWASPKFLIGESYGTTRSAMLANILQQRHTLHLNGVCLLSAVGFGNFGSDDRSIYFFPTFATSAWYHKLLSPELQKLPVAEVAKLARDFAHGAYAQALEKGDELPAAEKQRVVKEYARLTALSPAYIEEANLRVSPFRWFKELQRSKRLTTGRLDSRFTGMDFDAAGERVEYDASQAAYEGPYVATFQDYLRRELKWTGDQTLLVSGNVRPWDQGQPGQPAEALRSAMTQQPGMKLLILAGYYDLATPFNGIEHTVSHMSLEPAIRKNVSFTYYEAGHMMYVDKKCREKLHKDVTDWIKSSYRH